MSQVLQGQQSDAQDDYFMNRLTKPPSTPPDVQMFQTLQLERKKADYKLLSFPLYAEPSDELPSLEIINEQLSMLSSGHRHNHDDNDENEALHDKSRKKVRAFDQSHRSQFQVGGSNHYDEGRTREHKMFNVDDMMTKHFMEVWIGVPPQHMSLTVSTSSRYTVIGCGEWGTFENPMFNNKKSASFEKYNCDECSDQSEIAMQVCNTLGQCPIHGVYGRSKWTAYEARDLIRINGPNSDVAFLHSFACQDRVEGSTLGIMSMSSHATSFNNQMFVEGQIDSPDFSLCFHPPGVSAEVGIITLAGYNEEMTTTPMVYAENKNTLEVSYSVYVKNIFLRQGGGSSVVPLITNQPIQAVQLNHTEFNQGGGAEINVETPYTLLHESIDQSFRETWKELTGMEYVYSAFYLTDEDALRMPTILIQLRAAAPAFDQSSELTVGMVGLDLDRDSPYDVLLAIPPTTYLKRTSTGLYKTTISFTNKKGSILGANIMTGRLLHFGNSKIGFAEINSCNTDTPVPTPILSETQIPTFEPEIRSPTIGSQAMNITQTSVLNSSTNAPTNYDRRSREPTESNKGFFDSANNQGDHLSMKFLKFYIYAGGIIGVLGIGLMIHAFLHKRNGTTKFTALSL